MSSDQNEADLRERILLLERQLAARTEALAVLTEELARNQRAMASRPGASRPIVYAQPVLTPRQRLAKLGILIGGRLLPRGAKNFVKRFWDPWEPRRKATRPRPPAGPDRPPAKTAPRFDVICYSIIDWSFRWQRPQQMLSRFADEGHRVFLFRIGTFLAPGVHHCEVVPLRDNVWEVILAPPRAIDVYSGGMADETRDWFPAMLDQLRREHNIVEAVSLVQIATWADVALEAKRRFGWPVVYDCMDEWNTFPGMSPQLLDAEEKIVREADVVTVSGQRLLEKWRPKNDRVVLVRNAADFERFHSAPEGASGAGVPGPVIGYFGAIAAWFDLDLVVHAATERPQYSFVLLGGVFDVDVQALAALPNVHLLGQKPYEEMPAYLRSFDVCTIPFVVNEITAATDPVKFYEYISQGKPVVSTEMPELDQYLDLLYVAKDRDDFVNQLDAAVRESVAPADATRELQRRRVETARANTWSARSSVMLREMADSFPTVSIVIVSYNQKELTRACLTSVLERSVHPSLQIIVVDNASADGSAEMLSQWRDDRVSVILNDHNAGFAAANNQAARMATGQYLVLLNNDTEVPMGWLPRMLRHLEDPGIGLVVAVTNFSGNESRIVVPYETTAEMHPFAERYMFDHDGQVFDIPVAAMYCVGMRTEVFGHVGTLDEAFGVGMFEDDDYSQRVRLAGFRVVCAEDVFVHHVGQASFKKLTSESYEELWQKNQAYFEKKWGVPWQPHRLR